MKIFISWSGKLSNEFSTILGDWLNCILPNIPTFISSSSLSPGDRWSDKLAKELEQCNAGIICLTNENLMSPWINFEAGALSKHINNSMVIPLLINIKDSEISKSPLSQFQTLTIDKSGLKKLLIKLFDSLDLPNNKIDIIFDKWWDDLEVKLNSLNFPDKRKSDNEKYENLLLNYNDVNEGLKIRVNQIEKILSNLTEQNNESIDSNLFDHHHLNILSGLWESPITKSSYYGFFIDDKFHMPYLYEDNENFLAHFYNIKITKKRIYGEFKWLNSHYINGYFFLDIISNDILKGGWVYSNDTIVLKNSPNREKTELILNKVNTVEVPSWVTSYKKQLKQI
ncbi:hypothetical protein AWE51_08390 [Aquimarina aggregata]|uniref:TIR domain-containing protein n=1 Tax=Aquimarina aggregata TaxID=1642818 RepID=A0A162ZA41_9FLAO|nr:toll/interleukin-1 receptor domain-containing protein [Aquimarina aggregata]KZS39660.1 hypothetical protein AWE51_08390 [Aquimarina aggregata]